MKCKIWIDAGAFRGFVSGCSCGAHDWFAFVEKNISELMAAMDGINLRMGKGAIHLASDG